KAAFGVRAVEVILARRSADETAAQAQRDRRAIRQLLIGVTIHGVIMAGSVLVGWWWAALAWLLGVVMGFPLFAALRQLLEHTSTGADPSTDFRSQDHGAHTRLFEGGVLSKTFGAAGFNRHLLHHWEPQVSYTNLPELERFLEGTEVKSIM